MPDGSSTGIGVSVKRKEDYRFLVGEGNYTDDINRPNQTYSYMFRSNTAHANFKMLRFAITLSRTGRKLLFDVGANRQATPRSGA